MSFEWLPLSTPLGTTESIIKLFIQQIMIRWINKYLCESI